MPRPKEFNKAKLYKDRKIFRQWLKSNHNNKKEQWIVFYKKHVEKNYLLYEEAVEEAICFGWIDGKMKRIDGEKHIIRFSPRKANSVWSKINKDRALKMIRTNQMTTMGKKTIALAKKNGRWQTAYSSKSKPQLPAFIKQGLSANKKAWNNFKKLSFSKQNQYAYWILDAKRTATRNSRINKIIKILIK
jgi:uncharacterized protein YdeI (YjbR/CyaY-like superfamily)